MARRARRIPVVEQMTTTECGAACLAMVLRYFGRPVALEQVRRVAGPGRDGASARALLETARWFGLNARGVAADIDALPLLAPGSVLHWEFNHFVVLERAGRRHADIVDPASGRRRVSRDELRRAYTGVALLFEPGDAFQRADAPRSVLWLYARRLLAGSREWSRVLVVSLLLQVLALSSPVLTGVLIDRVVPHGDRHLLALLSAGFLSLVVFEFAASLLRSNLLLYLGTALDVSLATDFLDRLMDLPYAFFQQRPAGDLLMRLHSNATIREVLSSGALSAVLDGAFVTIDLVILVAIDPSMGALVAALGVLEAALFVFSNQRQRDLMASGIRAESRAQSFEVEMLAGIETFKAMGAERRIALRWRALFVAAVNSSLRRGRYGVALDSVSGALRMGGALAILAYGAQRVIDQRLSLGTMLALNALASAFLGPLASLVASATQLRLVGAYVDRITDVIETPPEQAEGTGEAPGELTGAIRFDGVSFSYGPRSPLVVREVSMDVAPGTFVAIVGRSGSGKSTLGALLLGLHRPTAGAVLYDGRELGTLDLRELRQRIGVVTQRPFVMAGTIRENIALGSPDATLEQIASAAQLACVDDEIESMPLGYDSLLADGGASISGGQRQRIALARALLGRPPIVLLDEATSALDAVTEAAVFAQLATLASTRIVVAHRLSTVRHADAILVMDDGELVERGTHDELVNLGGEYAALIAAQLDNAMASGAPDEFDDEDSQEE